MLSALSRLALTVLVLVLATQTVNAQEQSPGAVYYAVQVDVESQFFNQAQVETLVKRCIDKNLVSGLYRSYSEESGLRVVMMLSLLDTHNLNGEVTGTMFASHTSVRTNPTIIDALMPEKLGLGITGSSYDSAFLENFVDREIATVFGEFDQIREAIIRYENGE